MTEKEKELLGEAKKIMELNKNKSFSLLLTGSLMLSVRGLAKPREACDIDFVVCGDVVAKQDNNSDLECISIPVNYHLGCVSGRGSDPKSFQIEKKGIRVDFLVSREPCDLIDGILCASVEACLDEKEKYAGLDTHVETRRKHQSDLEFIYTNNQEYFDGK